MRSVLSRTAATSGSFDLISDLTETDTRVPRVTPPEAADANPGMQSSASISRLASLGPSHADVAEALHEEMKDAEESTENGEHGRSGRAENEDEKGEENEVEVSEVVEEKGVRKSTRARTFNAKSAMDGEMAMKVVKRAKAEPKPSASANAPSAPALAPAAPAAGRRVTRSAARK